jgi:hypothetical protein
MPTELHRVEYMFFLILFLADLQSTPQIEQ